MARLLMAALRHAGHRVSLISELRTYEGRGDARTQADIRRRSDAEFERIVSAVRSAEIERPDLWFSYHVYYKAPDYLGPNVATELAVPYVTAEASYARKRRHGPWADNDEGVRHALDIAAIHFCMTRTDRPGLADYLGTDDRLVSLPPFLDRIPEHADLLAREVRRTRLVERCGLDDAAPVILAVGMMREGDKLESYRMMASVLDRIRDKAWSLVIVGNGPARKEVEALFADFDPGRVNLAGARPEEELGQFYGAADLYFWPAVNEAYGMAFLEAQACGLPVVSRKVRGVPDVVLDGRTGHLAPADDPGALEELLVRMIDDTEMRREFGRNAAKFVASERMMEAAAARLDAGLKRALSTHA